MTGLREGGSEDKYGMVTSGGEGIYRFHKGEVRTTHSLNGLRLRQKREFATLHQEGGVWSGH